MSLWFDKIRQWLGNNLLYGENRQNRHNPAEFATVTSLVMPDGSRVWGIDISHWNIPPVNLKRMVDLYGLKFVIIKGCDGTLTSKYFAEHKAAAKDAGLPWGIYDWLYPNGNVSVNSQTTAWANQYNSDPAPLGIFVDAEWTTYSGAPVYPSASDLRMAHDYLKAKTSKRATTYTAKGYADTYLKGFDWTREPLWVANYGVSSPALPAGATGYKYWQFTSSLDGAQLDPAGNLELDGNYYNGTLEQFVNEYGGTLPPTGEPMYKKATGSITMRTGPGLAYPQAMLNGTAQYVLSGDILDVSEVQNGMAHIAKLWRNNKLTPIPPDPVWCGTLYLQDTTFTPPADTVALKSWTVTVTIDGVDHTFGS